MIAAGQSIGNYQILSKIGTGGMGAVYLAEHPLIGKKVALKVIHRELANNKEVVQRFFQEARAVNKIGNEHIVEIHDFGVSPEGDHFYIMEYLEGQTLASVLSRERALDVMRALYIGAQIASALGAAHAAGIIHRDLKPDNIMLMRRLGDPDFVKVLDFGLAKVFSAASAVKTAAGVLLGTPQYMSPEACESKRELVDHRTDIYALGVLLFQMMTGVLPFDGETMGEVLIKQVTALPPAPRGINPAIPPSVEQVLLRCLAKPVDARFPTMQALRDALLDPEAYLRASPPMSAARSVAPGEAPVDAKTMIQFAAQQKPRGASGGMPLAAPPSLAGVGAAPTMISDGPPYQPPKRATTAVPGVAPPNAPLNNTMRIATPMGYSSRPPRRVWPVVLAIGLVAGIGGGALAVVMSRRGGDDGSVAGAGSGGSAIASAPGSAKGSAQPSISPILEDAAPAVPPPPPKPVDAPVAPPPPPPPVDAMPTVPVDAPTAAVKTKLAKVAIDTTPPGADVFAPDGTELGKTPLKIEWPTGAAPVTFELRLAGYRKKPLELVVTGSTGVHVDLVRAPAVQRPPHHTTEGSDGLMRPDD